MIFLPFYRISSLLYRVFRLFYRLYEVPSDAFDDDYVEEPLAEVSLIGVAEFCYPSPMAQRLRSAAKREICSKFRAALLDFDQPRRKSISPSEQLRKTYSR